MRNLLSVFMALMAVAAVAAKPVVRENIEWLDVWLPNTNDHDLSRVLLIGDSITRGYGKQVEVNLRGKAYVGRMATSKSLGDPALLDEVALVLKEQSFDVIHFNNGMHGDGYTEEEYSAALPDLVTTLRRMAPNAKLICATTTDVRKRDHLEETDAKTKRIVERNRAAVEFAGKQSILVDDLFGVEHDHPEYHANDGVHFNEQGSAMLAQHVSRSIESLLGTAMLQKTAADAAWIDILPDESLKGWTRVPIPPVAGLKPESQWHVDSAQKTLTCTGNAGHEWLRYDKELGDFVLRVEWRFTPKSEEPKRYNSGIGIRLSKYGELWVQAQTGLTGGYLFGENLVDGAVQRFNLSKEMKENRVKPAGEWNLYEIRVQGGKVSLSVNGMVVSEVDQIALRRGYIGLEAEGYEITFRNLQLQPLD